MMLTPAPTCSIANLLFCKFMTITSTNVKNSKKSIRLPSVVSSSASKFPVVKSFQSHFLSTSSSPYDDPCNLLLHNGCTSTAIIRSSSSCASGRDFLGKHWGDKDEVDPDYEPGPEFMPQLDAIVLVHCERVKPDFSFPWRREEKGSRHGYGLIMSGRRVITTAHSVEHHTQLQVYMPPWGTPYAATMLAVAPEYDLAILTVNDDEFWKGVNPVEFGDMPSPGDKVMISHHREDGMIIARALGWGMTHYWFWGTKLLAFQVNVGWRAAPISGPAFDERCKCVGLKIQTRGRESDFVPAEVIMHFIQDYDKNGAYTGLPLLGIKWQKMGNPNLRMLMKMEHDQQGVLVTEVNPNYPESKILKPYDVILSIDGIDISNDGTVPFSKGQQIDFSYLIGKKYTGDKIVIKVRRGSKIREFITELATHKQFIPANITGRPLRYYIVGGFVFTTLSFPYVDLEDCRYDINELPDEDKLLYQALYEERVVLCQVLKADINAGYFVEEVQDQMLKADVIAEYDYYEKELMDKVLKADINAVYDSEVVQDKVLVAFNSKPVKGLKSLVSMIETCNDDFMKFTFANHKIVVLSTKIARSRTPDILKAHSVSCAMSDDLKELVKLTQDLMRTSAETQSTESRSKGPDSSTQKQVKDILAGQSSGPVG